MNHIESDGPLEDLAEKRDRQSLEKRQLAATAREAKRRDDDRIRKEEEKSDIGSISSSRRYANSGRRDSDFSMESVSSGLIESATDKVSMITELRTNLRNLEEQYERALFDNAELSSEKQTLLYEVSLLADKLEDAEETKNELRRSFVERRRENAYLKNKVRELEHQCSYMHKQLEQRDLLISESNCVILGSSGDSEQTTGSEMITNGDTQSSEHCPGLILVSKTLGDRIQQLPGVHLEEKLSMLIDDLGSRIVKMELLENQVRQLEDEVESSSRGQVDAEQAEKHREALRQLNDHKYKLQQSQQQITSLQADVIRLEGQVKRLTKKTEELEEENASVKAEARTSKRQVRELTSECEDLRSQNNSIRRNMERLKTGGRPTSNN